MQGVQILNQTVHEGSVLSPWFEIGLGLCFIGMIGAFATAMFANPKRTLTYAIFLGVFLTLLCSSFVIGSFSPREEITRYCVIVGDDVNFNEFMDKYKIIEQDGLIYTVEERECNTG
jgi:hypothetical protein